MESKDDLELRDESVYPDESVLQNALGPSYPSYVRLLELFASADLSHEWRYYNDGKAWLCKVQHKKRTIVWMSAWKNYLQATVYFPLSRLDLVHSLDINDETKEFIRNTKNVGKSKPCTFEIRDDSLLKDLEKVMILKVNTK